MAPFCLWPESFYGICRSKGFDGYKLLLVPAPEWILLYRPWQKNEMSAENIRQTGGKAAVHLRDKGMKKIAVSTSLISSLKPRL